MKNICDHRRLLQITKVVESDKDGITGNIEFQCGECDNKIWASNVWLGNIEFKNVDLITFAERAIK